MKVVIVGDTINFQGESFILEDLYDLEFFEKAKGNVEDYNNDSFFVNELYLNFTQNFLVLESFVVTNKITEIDALQSSNMLFFYLSDIASKHDLYIKGSFYFVKFLNWCMFFFHIFSSSIFLIFLMIKISKKKLKKIKGDITIVRTTALKNKVESLNMRCEYEDPYDKTSIYKYFSRTIRCSWVCTSLFTSFNQYSSLKKLIISYQGTNSIHLINEFYGKRLVHLNLYKKVLDAYLKQNNLDRLFTSNNLDRFAMVESKLAKKYKVQLIGIPHGLEYGFKFPKCFTGDIFYATSDFAVKYFNNLYKTSKFVFDKEFITSIFRKKQTDNNDIKIVYFSEPRESFVNHDIIRGLLPLFKKQNMILSLKLHPKEREEDYDDYDVEIIENFNNAITGNICFSRKSTILLEALYNNSMSSAILLNNKDRTFFSNFPSLQTEEINQAFSFHELESWIIESYKKKIDEKRT
ncbi:hypothetical protein LX97_02565 [Nonlabens dokdonensis]|uniref:Uncharacterized protein n=3 Tax=Nonlabens dokdonensis TaxID=328515 RepID=L7WEX0_NONDD|nr:hypothetical protein [Nonlabens dokdonensis]AGC78674.1 hypothetical protein DDD_3547 [Nonlabens dokdonensis DSW-6]PZX39199.1 hypothetical protein LX97_02565 [Nonlabens dokdonensis]